MRSLPGLLSVVAVILLAPRSRSQARFLERLIPPSEFGTRQVRGISDMDGDGRRDLLFVSGERLWVESSANVGAVLREYPHPRPPIGYVRSAAPVADLDGDGVEEIALAANRNDYGPGRVRVLSGRTGASLFDFGALSGEAVGPTRVEPAGDINGDGRGDLIVQFAPASGWPPFVRIYSGASATPLRTYLGRNWRQVRAFGDLDADGRDDLLVAAPPTGLRIHSGADDSILRDFPLAPGDADQGWIVHRGCDHDGDGFPDPVSMASYGGPAFVSRWRVYGSATGQLLYTLAPLHPSGYPPQYMEHAYCCRDADGDGVEDYAVVLPMSSNLWTVVSTATGSNLGVPWSTPGVVHELGDINGDGWGDIAGAELYPSHNYARVWGVLLGQPAPQMTCTPPAPPGTNAFGQVHAGSTSLSVGDRLVSSSGCVSQSARVLFVVGTSLVTTPLSTTILCVGERRALFEIERIDIGVSTCLHYFQHSWSRERLSALGLAPGDTLHTQFVTFDPLAAPNARVLASDAIAFTLAP